MANAAHSRSRVLVVDDDPIFRQLAISRMERASMPATEAQDGLEAWQMIRTGGYDVALIDLDMPNMNGFSLIQCVRSFPATRQLPLVVITSRDDATAVQKALEAGATGFLTKPVNWSMFLPYIEHMLELSRAAEEVRDARREAAALADMRGSITEILNTELRSRSRRIAATARRALDEFAEKGDSAKLRDALAVAQSEADAQRGTVAALAPYAELLTQPGRSKPGHHALTALMTSVRQECQAQADRKGIAVLFSQVPDIGLHCPREVFLKCVGDIVRHAVERAPAGTSVAVNAHTGDDGLTLHVTDDGPPLGLHLQRLLAEDRSARDAPIPPVASSGEVGLVMAASLARMMGGQLMLLAQQDRGATAKLALPAEFVIAEVAGHAPRASVVVV